MTPSVLKALRASLGLSQRALATAIGYRDPMSVSRWERGVEPIPLVVALAIEHLLCVANLCRESDRLADELMDRARCSKLPPLPPSSRTLFGR